MSGNPRRPPLPGKKPLPAIIPLVICFMRRSLLRLFWNHTYAWEKKKEESERYCTKVWFRFLRLDRTAHYTKDLSLPAPLFSIRTGGKYMDSRFLLSFPVTCGCSEGAIIAVTPYQVDALLSFVDDEAKKRRQTDTTKLRQYD